MYFLISRAHDDPNFINSQTYLPPELQIAPPKKANTAGSGGVGSGLIKAAGLKSYTGTSGTGRGRGRRGRPPKHEVVEEEMDSEEENDSIDQTILPSMSVSGTNCMFRSIS